MKSPTVMKISRNQEKDITVKFSCQPRPSDLDEDRIRSLEGIVNQHNLEVESSSTTSGFASEAGVVVKTLIIKDVTPEFEADFDSWVI